MAKIKVGVFGGARGRATMRYLLKNKDAELVAICDKFAPALERCRKQAEESGINVSLFTDFDKFLECDMDAIVLANYANEHAPYAIKCMAAGKNVMSEVLTCATMKEAVELIEAVEKYKKLYYYAENFCYSPAKTEMRRRYLAGDIGELIYAEGEYVHDLTPNWHQITYGDKNHWRNTMPSTYYSTHSLGPILYATGLRPVSVTAFETPNTPRMEALGMTAASNSLQIVTLENGAIVKNLCGVGVKPSSHHFRINGQIGCVREIDPDHVNVYSEKNLSNGKGTTEEYEVKKLVPEAAGSGHGGADFYTTYYLIRALQGDSDALSRIIDVYQGVDMCIPGILAYRSVVEGGTPQKIPNLKNPGERDAYRNDTFCTFKEIAGDMWVPNNIHKTFDIPDSVYDEVRRRWLNNEPS